MKKLKQSIVVLLTFLLAVSAVTVMPSKTVEAKTTVSSVVKTARYYYNDTNKKIKKGKKGGLKKRNLYSYKATAWVDKKGKVRKIIARQGVLGSFYRAYTVEHYYDKNEKLVFSFSYYKKKGKVYENRYYYKGQKIYRYINSKKKVKDYKNGKGLSYGNMDEEIWFDAWEGLYTVHGY